MGEHMERIMLTVKEVSEALGIGINQTYALVHENKIPSMKIGQQYLIPKDSFYEWIERNTKQRI